MANTNIKYDESKKLEKYGYDPLLTAIRLATVKFNEPGTKLAFYANQIYIQPPSYTQGASRTWYRNSKNELVELFIPIKQCIDEYVFKKNNSYVKEILRSSIDGLKLLQHTYQKDGGVILQIQFLIDMITDSLEGRTKDYTILQQMFGNSEEQSIYKELWNDLSINVLNSHLTKCNDEYTTMKSEDDAKDDAKDFDEQMSKLDGFINAKEKRYIEFLQQ